MRMPPNLEKMHPEKQLYFRFSALNDRAHRELFKAKEIPRHERASRTIITLAFGKVNPGILSADEMVIDGIDGFQENEGDVESCTLSIFLQKDGSPYVPEGLIERADESSKLHIVMPRVKGHHRGYGALRTRPFAMTDKDFTVQVPDPIRQYIGERRIGEIPGVLEVSDSEYLVSLSQTLEIDTKNSIII